MSQINGDKSRFNRVRKQNIRRRLRNQKLLAEAGYKPSAASGDNKSGEKKIKALPAK